MEWALFLREIAPKVPEQRARRKQAAHVMGLSRSLGREKAFDPSLQPTSLFASGLNERASSKSSVTVTVGSSARRFNLPCNVRGWMSLVDWFYVAL